MTNKKSQQGFTLVEMLVATFIFSIIATAVSSIFIATLRNEQLGFSAQKIQENGSYIMELMAREIRVSSIQNQDSPNCTATTLTVVHPVNGTVTYALNGGVLQRTAGGVTTELSSGEVSFSRLNFCVLGSGSTDQKQSRVTIIAAMQNAVGRNILTFNIETTVSSRNVDEFQNQ